MESGYVKVADKSEIPVGKIKKMTIKDKQILVVNVNGNYYAIGNMCTHTGGDLSQGVLEGNTLTCPKHHAKFDVTTGKVIAPPKVGFFHPKIQDEPAYPVKIENDNIIIKI